MAATALEIYDKYRKLSVKAHCHYQAIETRYIYTADGRVFFTPMNVPMGTRGPAPESVFSFAENLYRFSCYGLQDLNHFCDFFNQPLDEDTSHVENQIDDDFLSEFTEELLALQRMVNDYHQSSNALLVDTKLALAYFVKKLLDKKADLIELLEECDITKRIICRGLDDASRQEAYALPLSLDLLKLCKIIQKFDQKISWARNPKDVRSYFSNFLSENMKIEDVPLLEILINEIQEAHFKASFSTDLTTAQQRGTWIGLWQAPDSEEKRQHRVALADSLTAIRNRNAEGMEAPQAEVPVPVLR